MRSKNEAFFQKPAILILMALICCALWGSAFPCVKIGYQMFHIETTGSQILFAGYRFFLAGVLTFLIGFLSGGRVQGFTPASTLLLIYMALLSTIAFTLWTALLKYNPVGKIAIFGFSIPVFGILFSGIFLHESFLSVKNLIALLLVVIGIIIVNLHTSVLTRSKQAEKGADIC